MSIEKAYNQWAEQYDTNKNRTRDLEAIALREVLDAVAEGDCLEIGCGTGKNSVWLVEKCRSLTAVDLSEEMLSRAKEKLEGKPVQFLQADITKPWPYADGSFDLVTFSLVLEHINDLDPIFREAARCLRKGGQIYMGELHPFKQYTGTKARFETESGTSVVECYIHNSSDFIHAAQRAGMSVSALNEYFDEGDRSSIPRILAILFTK
ncbi:class I SAM-dependent methyltransferase [Flavihumibacter sp. ZG627]|uniref:class I SAM-dependent methyltransferase n=1 Tax=Flavihumibacter sp. ZG627 TaxID=1463156 RepID=UPI00057C5CED|nr:class I SAM-dependent methyltransferase [Flavihumibacter sp. ZG627]KIC90827.1 methyltransferase type 11 [Flavihumibacter sp. ZG627]